MIAYDKNNNEITFELDWNGGFWTLDAVDEDFENVDNGFTCLNPSYDIAVKQARKYISNL